MHQIGGGEVAWHAIGRILISADDIAEEIGYYVFLHGVPDPLFAGPPGEATAYFTVRSDPFRVRTITNGDVRATLLSPGVFKQYYNEAPRGDFADPDTFSSGELIATFSRRHAITVTTAGAVSMPVRSAQLESSSEFTFRGRMCNVGSALPNGVTEMGSAGATRMPGIDGFPVVLPFVWSSLAVGAR